MVCLPVGISHLLHSIFNSGRRPPIKGKEEEDDDDDDDDDEKEEEELVVVPLPDDILIDVLSRLPARAILRCRSVCRDWRSLTSSIHFVTLQAQRAPSVVLLQGLKSRHQKKSPLYIYDETSNKLRRIPLRFRTHGDMRVPFLYGAFGPLLHLKGSKSRWTAQVLNPDSSERDLVLNLITRKEHVVPELEDEKRAVYLSSLYFHKPTNEYKCLCKRYISTDKSYKYYSYSLASRTLVELAHMRFTTNDTSNTYPVAFKNALHFRHYTFKVAESTGSDDHYYSRHAVLVFEMDSEKFHTLPHPGFDCPCLDKKHCEDFMRLFVHDGHLALCHIRDPKLGLFDVWVLEDYEHWHWVRKWRFSLGRPRVDGLARYRYLMLEFGCFMVCSLGKEELLVDWFSRFLLVVNLKELTIKEVEVPHKLKSCVLFRRCVAYPSVFGTPHLP